MYASANPYGFPTVNQHQMHGTSVVPRLQNGAQPYWGSGYPQFSTQIAQPSHEQYQRLQVQFQQQHQQYQRMLGSGVPGSQQQGLRSSPSSQSGRVAGASPFSSGSSVRSAASPSSRPFHQPQFNGISPNKRPSSVAGPSITSPHQFSSAAGDLIQGQQQQHAHPFSPLASRGSPSSSASKRHSGVPNGASPSSGSSPYSQYFFHQPLSSPQQKEQQLRSSPASRPRSANLSSSSPLAPPPSSTASPSSSRATNKPLVVKNDHAESVVSRSAAAPAPAALTPAKNSAAATSSSRPASATKTSTTTTTSSVAAAAPKSSVVVSSNAAAASVPAPAPAAPVAVASSIVAPATSAPAAGAAPVSTPVRSAAVPASVNSQPRPAAATTATSTTQPQHHQQQQQQQHYQQQQQQHYYQPTASPAKKPASPAPAVPVAAAAAVTSSPIKAVTSSPSSASSSSAVEVDGSRPWFAAAARPGVPSRELKLVGSVAVDLESPAAPSPLPSKESLPSDLRSVHLTSIGIDADALALLFSHNSKTLKNVTLIRAGSFSAVDLAAALQGLQLELLHVEGCAADFDSALLASALSSSVGTLRDLTLVDLPGLAPEPELVSLFASLSSSLVSLRLSRLSGLEGQYSADVLGALSAPLLQKLSLAQMHIAGRAMEQLYGTAALPALTHLDLSGGCMLTHALAQLLKKVGAGLRYLSVADSENLDNGALKKISKHCSDLIELDIASLPLVTDEGVAQFEEKLPKLRKLVLGNCADVSSKAIHLLRMKRHLLLVDAASA